MPIYRNHIPEFIPYSSFYMIQPTHLMSKFCSNIKQISYYLYLQLIILKTNSEIVRFWCKLVTGSLVEHLFIIIYLWKTRLRRAFPACKIQSPIWRIWYMYMSLFWTILMTQTYSKFSCVYSNIQEVSQKDLSRVCPAQQTLFKEKNLGATWQEIEYIRFFGFYRM